jgi:NAD(P)-dependent dehydrogenase (short-subunit alcohol dehydrogenase family)
MSNFLITGASRGLGLELVRQLAASDQVGFVVAVTRNVDSPALQQIIGESQGRVANIVIKDITSEDSVKEAIPKIEQILPGGILDVLINNAGVMPTTERGITTVDNAQLLEVFQTNVCSVQAMTTTLLPLLERGTTRKIINM